jgi:hypothetical protein
MRAQTSPGIKPEILVLSQDYLEVNNLLPRETVWSGGGRPVYDRLPAACEAYRVFFTREGDEGYVYIPEAEGSEGPNSLRVDVSDDKKKILISGGTTLWKYGQVRHNPVYLDLETVGLRNTKYLLAYQMSYGEEPQVFYEDVESKVISGLDLSVEASSDDIFGWRFSPKNVFSEESSLPWKNRDDFFIEQPSEAFLRWANDREFAISKLEVLCPESYNPSGIPQADLFVESEFITTSQYNSASNSYVFWMDNSTVGKTWEIRFQDEEIEVDRILMDGKFPSLYIPKTPIMVVNLVAYPAYQYPEENFSYCKLALVDTDDQYRVIGRVEDLRNKVYQPFQPIADWLTRPWDDIFQDLYAEYRNFTVRRMAPTTAIAHEYQKLEKEGLKVEGLSRDEGKTLYIGS